MGQSIRSIRGMNDLLPTEIGIWQHIESVLRQLSHAYGYQEIRFPILEQTALFKRSIGDITDIVEKEMYTFEDRNGDSLSLRPEGTACCVRAALQHGLFNLGSQRLWYMGSMFRHERPQKGRMRQFHQFGLEAFGYSTPEIEVEMIAFCADLWQRLGISEKLSLQLNSLGSIESRQAYRDKLNTYFEQHINQLDADSQRRLGTNTLRILDSKNPDMRDLIEQAPKLIDHLDKASQVHFKALQALLDKLQINYEINPYLVRGLDYYSGTVFEWVTSELGAQGTVCAGGRYNGLIEILGGKSHPAVGFALGLERLSALLEDKQADYAIHSDIYCLVQGDDGATAAFNATRHLRQAFPQLSIQMHCAGGSLKSQFKKADKSGAELALIFAEDELKNNHISVKFMRSHREQETIPLANLDSMIAEIFQ